MPYWAVALVILVLIVGYYLLSQQARERRRERIGGDFGKIPNFYPNQTYSDVRGDAALGIDDRGRRIAVARKNAQPRTRVYSFAHIVSAEVVQDDKVIASITAGAQPPGAAASPSEEAQPRTPGNAGQDAAAPPLGGLYGSTKSANRLRLSGLPVLKPVLGQLTTAGVRVRFRNGEAIDEVLLRFYNGKPVNADGVEGERAFAEAQVLMGALDIAIKRAGVPPRGPAAAPRTPVT